MVTGLHLVKVEHYLVADRIALAGQHVTGIYFVIFQGVIGVHFHLAFDHF